MMTERDERRTRLDAAAMLRHDRGVRCRDVIDELKDSERDMRDCEAMLNALVDVVDMDCDCGPSEPMCAICCARVVLATVCRS